MKKSLVGMFHFQRLINEYKAGFFRDLTHLMANTGVYKKIAPFLLINRYIDRWLRVSMPLLHIKFL